jgi:hypothetical protein
MAVKNLITLNENYIFSLIKNHLYAYFKLLTFIAILSIFLMTIRINQLQFQLPDGSMCPGYVFATFKQGKFTKMQKTQQPQKLEKKLLKYWNPEILENFSSCLI